MFTEATIRYLADLADHNERPWFEANKARYERDLKAPALAFIAVLAPHLAEVAPHSRCDARALFRIHRDVRFSHDKSPYKTHLGLHFRHDATGDVHGPGLYLHVDPAASFVGFGIWQPDKPSLARIRAAIVREPEAFRAAEARLASAGFAWSGEALKRAPAGVDPEHPQVDLLKRKDHTWMRELDLEEALDPNLPERFAGWAAEASPALGFLCRALDLAW